MMKIYEADPSFKALVQANDGYCPCAGVTAPDTKCICKEFREQKEPGLCHCGRYMKEEV